LWRGLACLLVVVYHSTFYAAGRERPADDAAGWAVAVAARMWAGVPIFFVISGYCIAATVDSTRRRPRSLRTYFARRLRRIYPPFWAAAAASAVLVISLEGLVAPALFADRPHAIPRPESLGGWQWLGNLTLTESWRPHLGGGPLGYFLGHAWTLCYEEQFYAVSGLLLLLAPRRFFGGAVAVTGLTAATLLGARRIGLPVDGLFLDGHWLLFAAGILVYYRVNYAGRTMAWLLNGLLLSGIAYAAKGPGQFLGPGPSFDSELLVAGGFALLLSLAQPWDAPLASSAALRPLLFCGTMCYSLYLVHWPVVKGISHGLCLLGLRGDATTMLVTVPACLTASVALAWVFHRAVERPFLNVPQQAARPVEVRASAVALVYGGRLSAGGGVSPPARQQTPAPAQGEGHG
jgi:peptidoglycan/LPS O-acetylase OafA/YrhL